MSSSSKNNKIQPKSSYCTDRRPSVRVCEFYTNQIFIPIDSIIFLLNACMVASLWRDLHVTRQNWHAAFRSPGHWPITSFKQNQRWSYLMHKVKQLCSSIEYVDRGNGETGGWGRNLISHVFAAKLQQIPISLVLNIPFGPEYQNTFASFSHSGP